MLRSGPAQEGVPEAEGPIGMSPGKSGRERLRALVQAAACKRLYEGKPEREASND